MRRLILVSSLIALATACSGEDGANGANGKDGINGVDGTNGTDGADGASGTLLSVSPEAAGANCAAGGSRVDAGVDDNKNGSLDAEEIDSTQYLCDGEDGVDGSGEITAVATEAAGVNCVDGGVRIENGVDDNKNGTLEPLEIDVTEYVCNGAAGTNGTNGTNGTDGVDALTKTTPEAAGSNCSNAGVRLDVGPDTNGNNTLDTAEITGTSYICNGDPSQSNIAPVNAFSAGNVNTSGTTNLTAQSASITVPGSGSVVVVGSLEAFCYTTQAPLCADGLASGYMTISNSATANASTGNYSYFWLNGNTSNSATRMAVYPVSNAGTVTYYMRARADNDQLGFWRRQLTLMYIPH
jgi:hypothetical protein